MLLEFSFWYNLNDRNIIEKLLWNRSTFGSNLQGLFEEIKTEFSWNTNPPLFYVQIPFTNSHWTSATKSRGNQNGRQGSNPCMMLGRANILVKRLTSWAAHREAIHHFPFTASWTDRQWKYTLALSLFSQPPHLNTSLKNVFLVPFTESDIYGEVNCNSLEAKLIRTLFHYYYICNNKDLYTLLNPYEGLLIPVKLAVI
jgi:hypothetical protein